MVASVTSTPAWAQTAPNPYDYDHHMMWGSGYGMVLGPVFMIFWLAVAIAAIVLLVRWFGGTWGGANSPPYSPSDRTPLDILKGRYARGEIDQKEFEERRGVLGD